MYLYNVKYVAAKGIYLKVISKYWSGRQDLNLRPLDPQSSALPGCATPRFNYGRNYLNLP